MKKLLLVFCFLVMSSVYAFDEMLIGGEPSTKYPEIIYISNGFARCSATIVGPQVVLTAGHCVNDGGEIRGVKLDFKAICNQSPLYKSQGLDDMALCKSQQPFKIKPATVSKKVPKVGKEFYLSGYGCIVPGGGLGNDGVLRVGKGVIDQVMPGDEPHSFRSTGSTALCFGDSGGPAIHKGIFHHVVIGVNSRGNIKDLSLFTATFAPSSQDFLKDWAKKQSVKICGVNKFCWALDADEEEGEDI